MKKLNQIYVGAKQVELLLNQTLKMDNILKEFKREYAITKKPHLSRASLQEVRDSKLLRPIKSHDERYDGLNAVDFALEQLAKNGIGRELLETIYGNKANVKNCKMVGVYRVFNDLLSEGQLDKINDRLEANKAYMLSTGQIKEKEK